MPAVNLDIKGIKTSLTALKEKLDELGRHL
jgi:hypothetical protein